MKIENSIYVALISFIIIITIFFVTTRTLNQQHFEKTIHLIKNAGLYNIVLNKDILQIQSALHYNYDKLVEDQALITKNNKDIATHISKYYTPHNDVKSSITAFYQLEKQKYQLLERFKQDHALFSNATRVLPTLLDQVVDLGASPSLEKKLNYLVRELLIFSSNPGLSSENELLKLIDQIISRYDQIKNKQLKRRLLFILSHAKKTFIRSAKLHNLVRELMDIPLQQKAQKLENQVSRVFKQKVRQTTYLTIFLYLFCIALASLMIIAVTRLIKRRKQLKALNDSLEEKVIERTAQLKIANQSLEVQKEEIESQRDNLLDLNKDLEQKSEKILEQKSQIEEEQKISEGLLLNILPQEVAKELKNKGYATPKSHTNVSILFTDFAGFTRIAEQMTPKALVRELDLVFKAFDQMTEQYGIEKIKTIGDAYMCVGGLVNPHENHTVNTVKLAQDIQNYMQQHFESRPWELRCGIHVGEVTSGVVGKHKFAFDIWGDAVNVAARMESACPPGKINISSAAYEQIKREIPCEYRGKLPAKNKGEIDMYLIHPQDSTPSINR